MHGAVLVRSLGRPLWLLGLCLVGCAASPRNTSQAPPSPTVRVPAPAWRPSPCGRADIPRPTRRVGEATRGIDVGQRHQARVPVGFVEPTDADQATWLVGEPEDGSVRRGVWLREPVDDERFVSALTWSEVSYRAAAADDDEALTLAVFAAVEPGYVSGTGLSAAQAFSLVNYSASWRDEQGRLHLEYGRVWKGCERNEQYTHAVLLDGKLTVLSLFVNGSVPESQLERWLSGWFDVAFAGHAPSARRSLAGEQSRG